MIVCGDYDSEEFKEVVKTYLNVNTLEKKFGGKRPNI